MKPAVIIQKVISLSGLLFLLLTLFTHLAHGQEPLAVSTPAPLLVSNSARGPNKLAPAVQQAIQALPPGDLLTVIVQLKQQTNLSQAAIPPRASRAVRLRQVIEILQSQAASSQKDLRAWLAGKQAQQQVTQVTYFWIFNGLVLTATPAIIQEVGARPEVLSITANETIPAPPRLQPALLSLQAAQANLNLINIPALWDKGYLGQGVVVANMDTGVDVTHADLGPKWRGGSNSWFDPYGQHATPIDLAGSSTGHGTETMGVIVGGQEAGVAFGAAPQAQWIAVKIFKDDGTATTAGIHAGFQWLLDPDGNPATPDAPDVVNNSWTYGGPNVCNLTFLADLQALRTAGILPIFAAGNFGAGSVPTSASPANNPPAFAVGAVNNFDNIRSDSSRGPRPALTSCSDGSVFPEIVAPGTSIRTTAPVPTNYSSASGTSLAAPHIAGGLTLLLNAAPTLSVDQQEAVLLNSVVDLGAAGPDNTYGYGRIDFLTAFHSLFDVSVTQLASASQVGVGHPFTYTMTITNNGPLTATAVTLSDTLPPGLTFSSVTPSQGNCTGTGPVSCALGDLENGTAAVVTLRVTATQAGTMTHSVSVTGIQPDLNLANNSAVINTSTVEQVFLPVLLK